MMGETGHIKTTRLPDELRCPHCGKNIGAATSVQGRTPKVGSVGVCYYCAGIMIFGVGLQPQKLNAEGDARLRKLPEVALMLKAAKNASRRRP